jgi:D-lactate dehydrogenase
MLDVYFYEAFEEEAKALRRLLPATFSAGYTDLTIQEAGHSAPPAPVISVRTQSQLPTAWAPQLQAILSRSTGYDHLAAYAAATQAPVALGYLPLYCHRAVAEQAMLLWMALLRRLPLQMRQFHDFHRDGITGCECAGRTLAVVGVGHIGREVCRIGAALGMSVVGVDRQALHADVKYVSIDEALPQADVLVCAMDLNASNAGYFNAARWSQIKRGALFVNISRGELSPSARTACRPPRRPFERRRHGRLQPRGGARRRVADEAAVVRRRGASDARARPARRRHLHAAQRVQFVRSRRAQERSLGAADRRPARNGQLPVARAGSVSN